MKVTGVCWAWLRVELKLIVTSSMLVSEWWEAPDVTESNDVPNTSQQELQLAAPLLSCFRASNRLFSWRKTKGSRAQATERLRIDLKPNKKTTRVMRLSQKNYTDNKKGKKLWKVSMVGNRTRITLLIRITSHPLFIFKRTFQNSLMHGNRWYGVNVGNARHSCIITHIVQGKPPVFKHSHQFARLLGHPGRFPNWFFCFIRTLLGSRSFKQLKDRILLWSTGFL